MAMGFRRILDQNFYYYVASGLAHGPQNWGNVPTAAGYPKDPKTITLPSVCTYIDTSIENPFELGDHNELNLNYFTVSVFTKRDGQRDDLADYIRTFFGSVPKEILDFNYGFPPTGGQPSIGKMYFKFLNMFPVRDKDSLQRAEMHRMDLKIQVESINE